MNESPYPARHTVFDALKLFNPITIVYMDYGLFDITLYNMLQILIHLKTRVTHSIRVRHLPREKGIGKREKGKGKREKGKGKREKGKGKRGKGKGKGKREKERRREKGKGKREKGKGKREKERKGRKREKKTENGRVKINTIVRI